MWWSEHAIEVRTSRGRILALAQKR
ncbi:hypothetical protein FRIGORI9N_30049 [Frigoribacterium sp. 9N]|nr:hypothetical protein FRIGORI9N_30049 [Frigoribacterium sp. 9N]